ncbi:MAG: type VI secretion system tube protein Hcp [Bacteroidia bacterium]|nr:type VI secretion system tube protein Hcp [Bacteroidia bacterium]
MKNLLFLLLGLFLFPNAMDAQARLSARTVSAAGVDYFLKIEGIDGEATDQKHKDWIVIESMSHAMETAPSSQTGAARRRAEVKISDISVTKELDKASPKIMEAICTGKVIPSMQIHARKNGQVYMAYELKNVMVTSYQTSAEGEAPREHIQFNYEKIKMNYTQFNNRGVQQGKTEFSWDVKAGKSQ